jgi:hypothetical protein
MTAPTTTTYYTLITGGSSGIGKAIAWECASRGMNVLLVALPGRDLHQTAGQLRNEYPVKVETLEIDLTSLSAPQDVYNWCMENNYQVNVLVNNAGVAGTAKFEESPVSYSDERIQLNIRAVVLLTRLFIPSMKKLPKAYILNVSSLSAFYSIPYKSIYSASKAFVLMFSRAIKEELRETSIKISVLCPNGVRTNSGTHARIESHGLKGKLTRVPVEKVAKSAIKGLLNGKMVIIPGRINRGILIFGYFVPVNIKQRILAREFEKEMGTTAI